MKETKLRRPNCERESGRRRKSSLCCGESPPLLRTGCLEDWQSEAKGVSHQKQTSTDSTQSHDTFVAITHGELIT